MHKTMKMSGAAALVSLALTGCTSTGSLNAAATSDLQTALAAACPIVAVIQASPLKLNAYQQAALATLQLACPPNPPPTSTVVAVGDLIAAYTTLQPLIK